MKFLVELIPAHARKVLYAVLSAALVVYAIIEAAGDDWRSAAGGIITALVTTLATANTDTDVTVDETDELPPDDYPEGYGLAIREEGGIVDATGLVACVVVAFLLLVMLKVFGLI